MKIGTVLLDRYHIREELEPRYGSGEIFLAQDLNSQDLVTIEFLRPDSSFYEDDLKAFEKEAAILKNLDHPAIPKYLDCFEVEEYGLALVQTYIEASPLENIVLDGRKFSEAEAIELADQLLSILTYLHGQNPPVFHLNIRPSSILLANRSGNNIGDIYLVDFGSKQAHDIRARCTMIDRDPYGLHCYRTNLTSDLYSLGVTIIYLLTGKNSMEFINFTTEGLTVEFPAGISREFHRWLEKITQLLSRENFNSAQSAQISLRSRVRGIYAYFLNLLPML